MSELLQPLLGTIETVRERFGTPPKGGWNEAQTRASLIDPILFALGWDVADPAQVRHEYRTSHGVADYALMKDGEKLAAIIEAKAFGHHLQDKEIGQTNYYANLLGAPFAVLSDGDRWILYDVFKPLAVQEKQLLDTSLSKSESQAVAMALLALWRPNMVSNDWKRAPDPIRDDSKRTRRIVVPDPDPNGDGWYSLTDPELLASKDRPTAIRFPDKSEREIRFWKDILIQTAAWLWENKKLTERHIPAKRPGWKEPLIETPHVGRDETRWSDIPDTRYRVYSNLKRQNVVGCTEWLAQQCGETAASIQVQRG